VEGSYVNNLNEKIVTSIAREVGINECWDSKLFLSNSRDKFYHAFSEEINVWFLAIIFYFAEVSDFKINIS